MAINTLSGARSLSSAQHLKSASQNRDSSAAKASASSSANVPTKDEVLQGLVQALLGKLIGGDKAEAKAPKPTLNEFLKEADVNENGHLTEEEITDLEDKTGIDIPDELVKKLVDKQASLNIQESGNAAENTAKREDFLGELGEKELP